jgi:hypothetical protein
MTILELAWRDGEHIQRLTQTLDRSDGSSAPFVETAHIWQTAGTPRENALAYPVETTADPLALMDLESILENKPWGAKLLSEKQP